MPETDTNTTTDRAFFLRELERYGPACPQPSKSSENSAGISPQVPSRELSQTEASLYCRMWAKRQYENFVVASCLLPRRYRQDFYNIYAFCRWSDNLADELDTPQESLRRLAAWQQQFLLCYGGAPTHPVLRSLQTTIQQHSLPPQPFLDLLNAFQQDQTTCRYETAAELLLYCQRSANPVGQLLLQVADVHSEEALQLSNLVCTGLQLANFCQDMARDALKNRIYAPRSLWKPHGVTEEMLLAGEPTDQLREMLAAWVAEAQGYFESGWGIVHQVPAWLATDLELFVRGGVAILHKIRSQDYDVWSHRPTLSKMHQLQLLTAATLGRVRRRRTPPPTLVSRRKR